MRKSSISEAGDSQSSSEVTKQERRKSGIPGGPPTQESNRRESITAGTCSTPKLERPQSTKKTTSGSGTPPSAIKRNSTVGATSAIGGSRVASRESSEGSIGDSGVVGSGKGSGVIKRSSSVVKRKSTLRTSSAVESGNEAAVHMIPTFSPGVLSKVNLRDLPDLIPLIAPATGLIPVIIDSSGKADLMIESTKENPFKFGTTVFDLKSPNGKVIVDTKDLNTKVFMKKSLSIDDGKVFLRDKLLEALSQGSTLVFKGQDMALQFQRYYDDDYFPRCVFVNSGASCLKSEVWSKLLASSPIPKPPPASGLSPAEYVKTFSPNVEFNILVTTTYTEEECNDGFLSVSLDLNLFAAMAVTQ